MRKIQMVDLQSQYLSIKPEISEAIQNVLNNTDFIKGTDVGHFEHELAEFIDCKYVISCANGTDALQIALMSLDLKPGDEVITTPFSFVSTAEVIALLGLKPVFVDINPDTFLLDEHLIEAKITSATKAIIPVHLFGQTANMELIMQIASRYNLYVIEDSAQAIASSYFFSDGKCKMAGTIGHIGTTSFFPSKNLGAFGDGGALFTNSEQLAEKIRMIINHGSMKKYFHEVIGVNSRLDTIQAAILRVKLRYLDEYIQRRQAAATYYDQHIYESEIILKPLRVLNSAHTFHQYTIRVKNNKRDELKEILAQKQIPSMVYYPVPLHLQKAYKHYGYKEGEFPISEKAAKEILSLPMHTELDFEQLEYICNCLNDFQ